MAYPLVLPQPVREGYSAGPNQAFERTLMDDGQYSHRRVWSQIPMRYTLSWNLSFTEAELFEAWIEYDGNRGAGPLEIPIAGVTVTCRPITGMPSIKSLGSRWLVSLDVIEYQNITQPSAPTGILPEWPAILPSLEASDFVYGKVDAMLVSNFEAGPMEARVRFRDRVSRNESMILVNLEERNAFWSFYRTELMGGAAWFYGEFSNPTAIANRRIRIVEPPEESANGALFAIRLKLETTRAPIMDYANYVAQAHYVNNYVEAGYVEASYVGDPI